MYHPQTDKWHDRGNNPMDVDTPKRLSEPAEVDEGSYTLQSPENADSGENYLSVLQEEYADAREEETRKALRQIFGLV